MDIEQKAKRSNFLLTNEFFIETFEDLREEQKTVFANSAAADIEARDENGETPLHRAAWKGADDILDTLIRRGADAHAKNNKGETPLDVARIKYLTDTAYQQLQAASR